MQDEKLFKSVYKTEKRKKYLIKLIILLTFIQKKLQKSCYLYNINEKILCYTNKFMD